MVLRIHFSANVVAQAAVQPHHRSSRWWGCGLLCGFSKPTIGIVVLRIELSASVVAQAAVVAGYIAAAASDPAVAAALLAIPALYVLL